MMSNDFLPRNSIYDSVKSSNYKNSEFNDSNAGNARMMMSQISTGYANREFNSNLDLDWMKPETRVSHACINQISYLLIQMKEEIKRLIYYKS